MKLTKKLTIALLCLALVLASVLLVVGACDKQETGFKVTVADYDKQQGSVTVKAPKEGELFDNGEQATVTVTPNKDFQVKTFTVSGHSDASMPTGGGTYSFEVTADTTVTVEFEAKSVEPTTYKVTVAETANGTVKLSPEKDAYTEGESVTVTVTPATDYEVDTFTVSGHSDATLNNEGKYTFQVTGDTTVTVTFKSAQPEKTYTLTVVKTEGVTFSVAPEATPEGNVYTFTAGTNVTLTFSFDEGYELDILYVNEEEEELDEQNRYSFNISDDTTVDISAIRPFTQELLETLQGNVKFFGTLNVTLNGEPATASTIFTAFYPELDVVWQRVQTGETVNLEYFYGKTAEGHLGAYSHDIFTGKSELLQLVDSEKNALLFDDFTNAFDALTPANFTFSNGAWHIADPEICANVLGSVTGYTFDIANFEIILDDGELVINVVSEEVVEHGTWDEQIYVYTISLAVGETDQLPADLTEDYSSDGADLKPLADALQKARDASSFTLNYSHKLSTDESATDYNVFFKDGVLWFDEKGNENGYVTRPDGSVWSFEMTEEGEMAMGYDAEYDSIDHIIASFDLNGVFLGMFTVNEQGNFVLRDIDLNGAYKQVLATFVATSFTVGETQQVTADYATNIEISLDNGNISKVSFDYTMSFYGEIYKQGRVELTFSNFNATDLPAEVKLDQNTVNGYFATDWLGNWVSDTEDVEIFVTLDTVEIGYDSANNITKNDDGSYKLEFDDGNYKLSKDGDKMTLVDPDGNSHQLRFRLCEWENFVGEYTAKVLDEDYKQHVLTLNIGATSVTITFDGKVLANVTETDDIRFYEEDGELLVYTEDFDMYDIVVADLNNNVLYMLSDYVNCIFYRDGVVADLTPYKGTFIGEDNSGANVVIDDNGIQVKLPDQSTAEKAEDIYIAEYRSTAGGILVEITFTLFDGQGWTLQVISNDKMFLYDDNEDYGEFEVIREGYVEDYSAFYGDYTQLDDSNNTLKIEEGKITVVVGETTLVFDKVKYFDVEYTTPMFRMENENGDVFWLMQYGKNAGYFNFYDDEKFTYDLYFARNDFVPDWSQFNGTYYAVDDDDTKYKLVIGDNKVELTVGDSVQTISRLIFNTFISSRGTEFYQFEFVWNKEVYILQPAGETEGKISSLFFAKENEENYMFIFYLDQYTELDDWSDYVGTYQGEGFKVDITAEQVTLTVDGSEPIVLNVTFYKQYDYNIEEWYFQFGFDYNGRDCVLQPIDDNSAFAFVMFPNDDQQIKLSYVLVSSDYKLVEDYSLYKGYFEDDDGVYTVKIDDKAVSVWKNGQPCTVQVVYFGIEGGMVLTVDGKTFHILYTSSDSRRMYDNDAIDITLNKTGEPIADWSKHLGTYRGVGSDGKVYLVVIEQGIIKFSIDGVDVPTSRAKLSLDRYGYEIFTFTAGGINYQIDIYTSYFTLGTADRSLSFSVELKPYNGCPYEKYFGYWSVTEGDDVYAVEIAEDVVDLYINGTLQQSTFRYVEDDETFRVTVGDVEYTLELINDKINMFDGHGLDVYLVKGTKPQEGGDEECAFEQWLGVWTGEDIYIYRVTISASGIRVTYTDNADVNVDYFVPVAELTYSDETGFSWDHDGINWLLEISDDRLEFHDVDYAVEDVYIYLSRSGD